MRRAPVCVLNAWFATIAILLSGVPATAGDAVHGDRIDPSNFGPAIIETPAEAMARAAAAPSDAVTEPHSRNGRQGVWVIPGRRGTYFPHSGEKNAVNKWGDTRMGIAFPNVVDVHDAYFSGQAAPGVWTPGVRVLGYRSGREVGRTEWLGGIGAEPRRVVIDLRGVDRIVIESKPIVNGGGWYAMDDLSFTVLTDRDRRRETPADTNPGGAPRVIDFEDLPYHTMLTGSGYAGLVWETGTGDFDANEGIHAPRVPPGAQPDAPPVPPEPEGGPADDATLPLLEMSFQGVIRGDGNSFSFPPDTHGAVGPHHYVETINRVFAVFDKESGAPLLMMNLGTFLPGSNGDPRVLYDQHDDRWVVIVSDFSSRRIPTKGAGPIIRRSAWTRTAFTRPRSWSAAGRACRSLRSTRPRFWMPPPASRR